VSVLVILLGGATWFVLESPKSFEPWDVFSQFNYNGHNSNIKDFDAGEATADFMLNKQLITIPYTDTIQNATFDLDAAAGEFILNDTSSYLLSFYRHGTYGTEYQYSVNRNGHEATIKFSEKGEGHVFFRSHNHKKITIALNPSPVWDISLDAGASSVNYDLSKFKVSKVSLDGGAGSFNITLGDKYPNVKVDINAGASSLTLRVPENTGCDLEITAVLSGKHLPGFQKVSSGHYQTENYDTAKNKIHLNVDAAVSSFRIIRY